MTFFHSLSLIYLFNDKNTTLGELPDMEKLPESINLPQGMKLPEDFKLFHNFQLPEDIQLPSYLEQLMQMLNLRTHKNWNLK